MTRPKVTLLAFLLITNQVVQSRTTGANTQQQQPHSRLTSACAPKEQHALQHSVAPPTHTTAGS